MSGTTPADIVNRALQQIAAQATITGAPPTFDGTPTGIAAGLLYEPMVQMLLRSQDWEFARRASVPLALDGNTAAAPWAFEYAYPADCMRLRSVAPASFNANDPAPVRWEVGTNTIAGVQSTVILTNQAAAVATYTSSNVTENDWDPMFAEAVVRALASELAMAVGGRPDISREKLGESGQIAQSDQGRDS